MQDLEIKAVVDLSHTVPKISVKSYVMFSTNPTQKEIDDLPNDKILIIYSKDHEQLIEWSNTLNLGLRTFLFIDQSPVKMVDGRELSLEEYLIEMMDTTPLWYAPAGFKIGQLKKD